MKKLTKKKKEKIQLIASLFIIGIIILFKPVFDIVYFSDYYINNNDYKKTSGVVFSQTERKVHTTRSATTRRTYNVFRYVVNGKVYYHNSHIWSGSKELKLNNKEFIYYNVDNPNKAYSKFELDNKFRNLIYVLVTFVVYFLFIIILTLPDTLKKK